MSEGASVTEDTTDAVAGRDHYQQQGAENYLVHHQRTLRNRLTSRRELAGLEQALRDAGCPRSALDLPCGTGRFWPAFRRAGVETLIAGDVSDGMLAVAEGGRLGPHHPERLLKLSAFDVDLPDDAVDFVACMRFYHHVARPEYRLRLLGELGRVSRGPVALSLWVDGNLGGLRRMRRQRRRPPDPVPGYGPRICRPRAEVEAEFAEAGFRIVRHYDVWPLLDMWRLYLLTPSGG